MKKILSFFAATLMAASMWAADFSGGATFNFKYASDADDVYATANYVKGSADPVALTQEGTSYWYANAASSTFTLVDNGGNAMYNGLSFTSGSTAKSTRFYKTYGFYMGQNATKITIEGASLVAGQQITIDYNVTGNTNDNIKVTNATGTIPNTTAKNATQTCTLTVTNSATNVEISRNGQTVEITRIVIAAAPTDPIISASNVTIEADATSGEIPYSVENSTVGVAPTAALTTGDWISNVQVDAANDKVTFTAAANTIHTERTATITISYTGATDKVITVTQKRATIAEIVDVTGAMTWDFSGYANDVTVDPSTEVILGNHITMTTGDADALKGKQQYIVRKSYCWQGFELTFHPTVAGVVSVNWSSTSGSNYRTLKINEGNYAVEGGDNSTSAAGGVITKEYVPANEDVVLTGWDYKNEAYTANQIRIWSMSFTPATTITLNEAGFATYSNSADVEIVGATVYKAAVAGSTITLTAIEGNKVPANTGVILYGAANATVAITTLATAPAAVEGNALLASGNGTVATPANTYVLNGNQFLHYTGATLAANKAYLTHEALAPMTIVFNEEITGVEDVIAAELDWTKPVFNILGQQVAEGTTGILIQNGVKFIVK